MREAVGLSSQHRFSMRLWNGSPLSSPYWPPSAIFQRKQFGAIRDRPGLPFPHFFVLCCASYIYRQRPSVLNAPLLTISAYRHCRYLLFFPHPPTPSHPPTRGAPPSGVSVGFWLLPRLKRGPCLFSIFPFTDCPTLFLLP